MKSFSDYVNEIGIFEAVGQEFRDLTEVANADGEKIEKKVKSKMGGWKTDRIFSGGVSSMRVFTETNLKRNFGGDRNKVHEYLEELYLDFVSSSSHLAKIFGVTKQKFTTQAKNLVSETGKFLPKDGTDLDYKFTAQRKLGTIRTSFYPYYAKITYDWQKNKNISSGLVMRLVSYWTTSPKEPVEHYIEIKVDPKHKDVKNYAPEIKVGDVVSGVSKYMSSGSETPIFYQVISRTPKTLKIQELRTKSTGDYSEKRDGLMSGALLIPILNNFYSTKQIVAKVSPYGTLNDGEVALSLWDGKPIPSYHDMYA